MGLFRGLVPFALQPRGPRRPGTHYRHYHEFLQLLPLCCTATKMAAGRILPCKEDALRRLLLFLSWRLCCWHVVPRYNARQLTSRMAAGDGRDNWPCQDYDSTFTWFARLISSYILYFVLDKDNIFPVDESQSYIRFESNLPILSSLIISVFVPGDDKTA